MFLLHSMSALNSLLAHGQGGNGESQHGGPLGENRCTLTILARQRGCK
jgi:hypothetical protein